MGRGKTNKRPTGAMTPAKLRLEARQRIAALSPERLLVALDFLAYLGERESTEATEELLRIPGFVEGLEKAEAEIAAGKLTDWRRVRRDV